MQEHFHPGAPGVNTPRHHHPFMTCFLVAGLWIRPGFAILKTPTGQRERLFAGFPSYAMPALAVNLEIANMPVTRVVRLLSC